YMTPRNWLGVALIFLFLPVNVPLWDMAFNSISLNISAVAVVPLFFLLGLLILFIPAREKKGIADSRTITEDDLDRDEKTEEE
ncbi:MAG TPA: hypothetical protein HA340_04185, partial [Candidatus Thalassarchaeaceae archaeon]